MARPRKNNMSPAPPTAGEVQKGFTSDMRFRSYKNDGKGFDEFHEGDEIVGILVSIRDHQITDRRTNLPKEIRVYSIRTDDGTVKKVGGRALLDRLVDDIMDEYGGFIVENRRYSGQGYVYIQNRAIKIVRGDDSQTHDGNPLGTYEVAIEE
jgi:hypothetical protein